MGEANPATCLGDEMSSGATYFLIHFPGGDVAKVIGGLDVATTTLDRVRQEYDENMTELTGKRPDIVPYLIGVYPPNSIGGPEGKGGVYSYGFKATHIGDATTHYTLWEKL